MSTLPSSKWLLIAVALAALCAAAAGVFLNWDAPADGVVRDRRSFEEVEATIVAAPAGEVDGVHYDRLTEDAAARLRARMVDTAAELGVDEAEAAEAAGGVTDLLASGVNADTASFGRFLAHQDPGGEGSGGTRDGLARLAGRFYQATVGGEAVEARWLDPAEAARLSSTGGAFAGTISTSYALNELGVAAADVRRLLVWRVPVMLSAAGTVSIDGEEVPGGPGGRVQVDFLLVQREADGRWIVSGYLVLPGEELADPSHWRDIPTLPF